MRSDMAFRPKKPVGVEEECRMNAQEMRLTALGDQAWAAVMGHEGEFPALIEKLQGDAVLTARDRGICAMVLCSVFGKMHYDRAIANGEAE